VISTIARRLGRRASIFLALLSVLTVGLVTVGTSPAFATDPVLCSNSNYSTCTNAGYTDHGFGSVYTNSYWHAFGGHNCTNYAGFAQTQNGVADPGSSLGDGQYWDTAAAGFGYTVNTVPAVGAVAQWEVSSGRPYGHVAEVEALNADGSITISQDVYSAGPFSWQTIMAGSANWPNHFIHFKDGSAANSSAITPDGVLHVYTAMSSGKVFDTSWGNGAPLTTWQVTNLSAVATSISSQVINGVQHVYVGTASGTTSGTVQDISWGNGAPLTVWQVASFGSAVRSVSSQVVGGVQHVYAATATTTSGTVQDISWGNGAPLTVWQVGSFGSPVASVTSQLVTGVLHVYAAAGATVQDISWGNGAPLTVWQVGSFGSAVRSVSSQLVTGVQHVYVAVGTTVQDISWGNGAPLTIWQVANLTPRPVTSVTSQLVTGVQHVYAVAGFTAQDVSWGNGAPLTVWQVASLTAGVTSVSSQVVGGVQHVFADTGFTAQDVSWGNGAPLTLWQVGQF
jgi:surface antigen